MVEYRKFLRDDLEVREDDERRKYYRRTNEKKTTVTWGQRKLMLVEIEFFSIYWDREKVPYPKVVYAGAAPGKHIEYLAELFPDFEFFLWDPQPFQLAESKKIHIFQDYFTEETAQKWTNREDVFFISDIRTANYRVMTPVDNELAIISDLNLQKKCHNIIKPVYSLLKFRLPYNYPETMPTFSYFKGTLYRQPWAPQTSTETRLVPDPTGLYQDWDCQKYEEQLFHFNTIIREHYRYLNPCTSTIQPLSPPELLNDYDSLAEITILSLYCSKLNLNPTSELISQLSQNLTHSLNKNKPFTDSLAQFRLNPKLIKDRNSNKSTINIHSGHKFITIKRHHRPSSTK